LVVQPVVRVRLCVEDRLQNTQRGAGGFGHTGR
jgi:dUTPase